ncbi:PPPDE putative peptidase domain-containing protein [Apodospora peruviana]|uniref:PPPDE putative peptidase domain-containing protein n=1 Tax=Apodospora peruviana TaxID=516989 RepID=A0AAE0ISE1_9PEZI|nr:PPPDE putative peptidase domain-containing protein [Apodospora peruviana]
MPPSRKSQKSAKSHRSTMSLQKTEIIINVYDLLPPGRISSTLWFLGTSLLHSGVVINGKEYAYGGHERRGVTGVYWTKPKTEPPGGTFKCEILHGFTLATQNEIDTIIRDTSEEFLGTVYNLLTKNCNHFTSYLCQRLTGRPGPGWLNRAASIGVALPCVVPRDWIEAPEFDTADGELLDEDDHANESSRMLRSSSEHPHLVGQPGRRDSTEDLVDWDSEEERQSGGTGKGKGNAPARDSAGRTLPASERAPVPRD